MSKNENYKMKLEVEIALDLIDFINDNTLIFGESISHRPHLKDKKIFSIEISEEEILNITDVGVNSFQMEENIEELIKEKFGNGFDLVSYDSTKILDYEIKYDDHTVELKLEVDVELKKKEVKNGNKAKV